MGKLSTAVKCEERIRQAWPDFVSKRRQRMEQGNRFGTAPEKITITLLEDLFTNVLDWSLADINHEVDYADVIITQHGIKTVIVEAKRPLGLAWNQHAVAKALGQARRYADAQRVPTVAITDGAMLYAADIVKGVLRDRTWVHLDSDTAQLDLWWLSVHGIYRTRPEHQDAAWRLLPWAGDSPDGLGALDESELVHPKYHLPASCFAYVGDANRTTTWRLPYRLRDGSLDHARLPKAIQAILSNYRGARVGGIPDAAIPDVLLLLARAADQLGHMPPRAIHPAAIYGQLDTALTTLGLRLESET